MNPGSEDPDKLKDFYTCSSCGSVSMNPGSEDPDKLLNPPDTVGYLMSQ